MLGVDSISSLDMVACAQCLLARTDDAVPSSCAGGAATTLAAAAARTLPAPGAAQQAAAAARAQTGRRHLQAAARAFSWRRAPNPWSPSWLPRRSRQ